MKIDNDIFEKLSLKTFVEISNTFSFLYAAPDTIKWYLKVEHVTHRGFEVELEGNDLGQLLCTALEHIERFEQSHKEKIRALEVLHPDKDEYDIAEMLRNLQEIK